MNPAANSKDILKILYATEIVVVIKGCMAGGVFKETGNIFV